MLERERKRVGGSRGTAAVGDEDVDRAQLGLYSPDQVGGAVDVGGIVREPGGANPRRRGLDSFCRSRADRNSCALVHERSGDPQAEALRCARDERHFPSDPEVHADWRW